MGIKGYVTIAAAVFFFGAGWAVNGWRLGKKVVGLEGMITQYEQTLKGWQATVSNLQTQIAENNKTIDMLHSASQTLGDNLAKANERIKQLLAQHAEDEANHQQPLPSGCEDAVREAARRAGAK